MKRSVVRELGQRGPVAALTAWPTMVVVALGCGASPAGMAPGMELAATAAPASVSPPLASAAPLASGESASPAHASAPEMTGAAPLSAPSGLDDGVLRRWGGGGVYDRHRGDVLLSAEGELAVLTTRRQDGAEIYTFARGGSTREMTAPGAGAPPDRAVSPTFDRLVTSGGDAAVWDLQTGARVAARQGLAGPLAITGRFVVGVEGGAITAWDLDANVARALARLKGRLSTVAVARAAPVAVALEVRRAAGAKPGDETEHLWACDLEAGTARSVDLGARRGYRRLALDADGSLAFIIQDRAILRIDLAAPGPPEDLFEVERTPRGPVSPAFVAGRRVAAVGSGPGVALFDPLTGAMQRAIDLGEPPRSLALSADEQTVTAVSADGEVRQFRVAGGEEVEPPPGRSLVRDADVDPATRIVVTAGTRLELWDVETGTPLRATTPAQRIVRVALIGDAAVTVDVLGNVDRWDLATLAPTRWHVGRTEPDPYDRASPLLAVDAARGRVAYSAVTGERFSRTTVRVVDAIGAEQHAIDLDATALAFDEEGRLAVGHDGNVTVFDAAGAGIWRHHRRSDERYGRNPAISALALGGGHLALDITGVEVWDRARDAMVRAVPKASTAVAFVDAVLVAGDRDGALTSVALDRVARRSFPALPTAVAAIRPSARGVLIAAEDGTAMIVEPRWLTAEAPRADAPKVKLERVADLPGVEAVEVFGGYAGLSACAIAKGEVFCWGKNEGGALGLGDERPRDTPTALGIGEVRRLVRGPSFVCATRGADRPICWGKVDRQGRSAWNVPSTPPTALAILPGEAWRGFSAGRAGWCAIRADLRVTCGRDGRVATVVGLGDARVLAMGNDHGCAIDGAGKVWCWGGNQHGQLGAGRATPTGPAHAVTVIGVEDAVALAAGAAHTCALTRAGQVACWGAGQSGQLGDGTFASHALATPVAGVEATAIAAGAGATCAVVRGGGVACWGDVRGVGEEHPLATPTSIPGLADVAAVSTTGERTCVARQAGPIDCWGVLERP